jgi:hypothetical protein
MIYTLSFMSLIASFAIFSACHGDGPGEQVDPVVTDLQLTPWTGQIPSEAAALSDDDITNLIDQDGIRQISRTEFDGRLTNTLLSVNTAKTESPSTENATAKHPVLSVSEGRQQAEGAKRLARSKKNRKAVYELLYSRLPDDLKGAVSDSSDLDKLSVDEISKRNNELAQMILAQPAKPPAASAAQPKAAKNPPSHQSIDCTGDENYIAGQGYDHAWAAKYSATSADGLLANFDLPLKSSLTCVKNQANRGTCVAFTIAGVLETEIAAQRGRYVNLSEQSIYAHIKNSAEEEWSDGASVQFAADSIMAGMAYAVPKEEIWPYNPSWWRQESMDAVPGTFTNSCYYYSPTDCSDTSHQSILKCGTVTRVTGEKVPVCGLGGPLRTGQSFQIGQSVEIWNAADLTGTFNQLMALLKSGKPVGLSLDVPPTFDNVDANGFVDFIGAGETSRGAHALVAIGYVSNTEMTARFGASARQGSGGGYIVVKNSWGFDWGDHGYMYLPVDWLKTYGYAGSAFSGQVSIEEL